MLSVACILFPEVLIAKQSKGNETILALNHYTALQPAYTSGSLGMRVAVGYEKFAWDSSPKVNRQVYIDPETDNGQTEFLTVLVNKGTRWPIDFSAQASQALGTDITKVGAHLQWSLFQGFKLPTIALRASGNRTWGLRSTEISGTSASAVIDYSLFSYFTAFYNLGWQSHQMKINYDSKPSFQLDSDSPEDTQLTYRSETFGLLVRAWPGVGDLRIAKQQFLNKSRYVLSASFGI